MPMKTLGERVRFARQRVGKNQTDFADAIGVGKAAMSKIESGQTKTLNLDTALGIQKLTGVSAAWLRTGKGPIEQSSIYDAQIARIAEKLLKLPQEDRDKIEGDVDYITSLR